MSSGAVDAAITLMSFFAHSYAGFTRKLSCYTSSNTDGSITLWIDGPYGGLGRRIENEYDARIYLLLEVAELQAAFHGFNTSHRA